MATRKATGDPVERLRAICLALPDATEKIAWGTPTFRVRDKIFAMVDDHHHGEARLAVWCKAPPGVQEILVGADPRHYFRPPYVGPKGWVGARIDPPVDWDEIVDLTRQSYRMTAPRRIVAAMDAETAGAAPQPHSDPRPAARTRRAQRNSQR